jgi:glyceraldehyde 3-phosphate dehydrogenase
VDVVAINDMFKPEDLGLLLKYDSVYGRFDGTVEVTGDGFKVNGSPVKVLKEKDPIKLPWGDLGVDLVIESTGVFRQREQVAMHLTAGAKKAILTVPAKDEIDRTVVLGVNEEMLESGDQIVSNASCTTNCLGPISDDHCSCIHKRSASSRSSAQRSPESKICRNKHYPNFNRSGKSDR